MLRLGLILSVSLLWFFANTGQSSACSCGYISPSEAFAYFPYVFTGTVIRDVEIESPNADETSIGWIYGIVALEVTAVWKGPLYETTYVTTKVNTNDREGCGFDFIRGYPGYGKEFLVYAYDGYVSMCSRTRLLDDAQEDLDQLGEGRKPLPGTKGPLPGTPEFPPQQSSDIEWVEPASGGCHLGSATSDAAWLGIMAGLVWFGVRRRPRR